MNCALCQTFQGKGIVCPGCGENVTRTSCRKCSIRLCGQKTRFCFTCSQYPCARLKRLDKRYRLKYGMSMLDNLNLLKEQGMEALLAQQRAAHTCPGCAGPEPCIKVRACTAAAHRTPECFRGSFLYKNGPL